MFLFYKSGDIVLACHITICCDGAECVYMSASPHCTCIHLLLPTVFITHNINVEQDSGWHFY